jgi:hypothetical protein
MELILFHGIYIYLGIIKKKYNGIRSENSQKHHGKFEK